MGAVRKYVGAVGVVSLAGGILLSSATVASAATYGRPIACQFQGYVTISPSTLGGAVANDLVVITDGGGVSSATVTFSGVTGLSTWSSAGSTSDRTYTITSSSPAYITMTATAGSCSGTSATLSINGGMPSPSSSASASAPAPIVQQFGVPAMGTCDAAASASLNWAGVASGGWSISWGEWMNGGRGGAVCTRTLVYSTQAGAWGVAS